VDLAGGIDGADVIGRDRGVGRQELKSS
jgi:hypothetical protein